MQVTNFGTVFVRSQSRFQSSIHRFKEITSHVTQRARTMSDQAQPHGTQADDQREEQKQQSPQSHSFVNSHNLRNINVRVKTGSTPYCATVIHPGFSPDAIDPDGKPFLTTILKATSLCRIFALNLPVDDSGRAMFEYDKITRDSFTFISSTLVDISPTMYDTAVPKWPLEVKIEGGHIGRSSMSLVSTMTSPSQPQHPQLMTQISQVVLVDRVNRRPKPIEDEFRDRYQSHCVRGEPLIFKRQEFPSTSLLSIYQVKIAWSDTDIYQHTNFASYVRFAVDAVHDALSQDKLGPHLTAADVHAGVSQLKVAYLGESVQGDELQVKVWGAQETDRCVVCSMEKGEQVINQTTLTFFSP